MMSALCLDGKVVAKQIEVNIKRRVQALSRPPHLVAINASNDPASDVYVGHKQRACERVGIRNTLVKMNALDPDWGLLQEIKAHNNDPEVDGILVQLPLPVDPGSVFDAIDPAKDIDVFNPTNVGMLLQGRPRFLTCTPNGIRHLLRYYNIPVQGRKVAVINSSNIVGKPLFALLVNDGATVTICNHHTPPELLKQVCLGSEIIVVAVGIPGFLTADMVTPDSVVVDVGITRRDGKILGDVDYEPVSRVVKAITPVPGGVGPMTVAMLLENTTLAAERHFTKIEAAV
jgi:methylenetetrahydrofolate dehydrogenase (NADP+)/methenyltetrahydrofolate cyclohydrolase